MEIPKINLIDELVRLFQNNPDLSVAFGVLGIAAVAITVMALYTVILALKALLKK